MTALGIVLVVGLGVVVAGLLVAIVVKLALCTAGDKRVDW